MENDMEILLKLLDENDQTVEGFLKIKLPFSYSTYFKMRTFLICLMKCIGISILIAGIIISTFILSLLFLEYFNIYPINRSKTFIYESIVDSISFIYSDETIESSKCLINNMKREYLRLPADCNFCRDVKLIKRVSNLSRDEFKDFYAYSGKPIVVTDATINWTAKKLFSFDFFQTIYTYALMLKTNQFSNISNLFTRNSLTSDAKFKILLDNSNESLLTCQFFNYQTDYTSLEDFLARNVNNFNASFPWYVGWSNCDPLVSKILRQHYSTPYFLPENSESHNSDWIFMGHPGYGAKMHIDFVDLPSWQAQLKGRKLWKLKPPQECIFSCPRNLEVVVEPGDIIVMDTNLWYHQTEIIGDDISVTIGAEFD